MSRINVHRQHSNGSASAEGQTLGGFLRHEWGVARASLMSMRGVLAEDTNMPRHARSSRRKTAAELVAPINSDMDKAIESLIREIETNRVHLADIAPYCVRLDRIVTTALNELNNLRYGMANKYRALIKEVRETFRDSMREYEKARRPRIASVVTSITDGDDSAPIAEPNDQEPKRSESPASSLKGSAAMVETIDVPAGRLTFEDVTVQMGMETAEDRVAFMRVRLTALASTAYWGFLVSLSEEPMNLGKKLRAKEVKSLAELYKALVALMQSACTAESTATRSGIIASVSAALSTLAQQSSSHPDERLVQRCEATVLPQILSFLESKEDDEIFVLSLLDLQSSDDFTDEDTIRGLLLWQKIESAESYPMMQAERQILGHAVSGKRIRLVRSMVHSDQVIEKLVSQINDQCHGGYPFRTPSFVRSMIEAHYLNDNESPPSNEVMRDHQPAQVSFDAAIATDANAPQDDQPSEPITHAESDIPQSFPQVEIDAAKYVLRQEGLTNDAFLAHGSNVKKLWQKTAARAYGGRGKHAAAEYRKALLKHALMQTNAEMQLPTDPATQVLKIQAIEEQEKKTIAVMVANHRKRGGSTDDEFVRGLTSALNIKRVRNHLPLLTMELIQGMIPPAPVQEPIALEHIPIVDQRSVEERFLSHFVEYIRTYDALGGVLEERIPAQRISIVEVLVDDLEQHLRSHNVPMHREIVKRTVLYGLEHAHLPQLVNAAYDKRDPTSWILSAMRKEVYGNGFMPSMRVFADYVRENFEAWDGGRAMPELTAYLSVRRKQENVLDLGPVASRAGGRTSVAPALQSAPVYQHEEPIKPALDAVVPTEEPLAEPIVGVVVETTPSVVDEPVQEIVAENIHDAPTVVVERADVAPEPEVAPVPLPVETMVAAAPVETGLNLHAWTQSLMHKITGHRAALEQLSAAASGHAGAIDDIEDAMNALQDSIEGIRLPARQAVAFCQNAMLHAKTLKPGALDIQESSMHAHLAVIDTFEEVSARLREHVASIDAQKHALAELAKPYYAARDFVKLLQHPLLEFPKDEIGMDIVVELIRVDNLLQGLARRLDHCRSDSGDMWETHVAACPYQEEKESGVLSTARRHAEFVLQALNHVPTPPEKPKGDPADIPKISFEHGGAEVWLSDIQVRCLQLLTTQTLNKKAVRHTSWGHTSAKIREYWSKVFGEPAPSVEEIELALSQPSIMRDERSSRTKVVTGAMRALPALVCLWELSGNELYLPTHRAFDLIKENDAALGGDALQIFQELKETEQKFRKEFRQRYGKKKGNAKMKQ